MADQEITQGDLEPPLLLSLADDAGLLAGLDSATSITVYAIGTGETDATISGSVEVLDPPTTRTVNGAEVDFNGQYTWQTGDTDVDGAYIVVVQIEWTTGRREWIPNDPARYPTLTINPAPVTP